MGILSTVSSQCTGKYSTKVLEPTQRIAYDGEKMGIDTQAWIKQAKESENQ